jgi:hypothetical protein
MGNCLEKYCRLSIGDLQPRIANFAILLGVGILITM